MSSNRILQALFWAAAAASLFFSCRLGLSFASYLSLSSSAKGQIERWEIDDRQKVKAVYNFEFKNKIYLGSYTFRSDYLNEYAARAAVKEKAAQPQTVWFDPKDPSRSALETAFPFNLFLRALICYSVLIYLFYLNRKVRSLDLLV